MVAVLRILWDVLAYRLRKLEMANLAAAVAIMLVLRLEPQALLLRTIVAFLLNLLVYLNNDYCDIQQDLSAHGRDVERTRFLSEHMAEARLAQLLVAALLMLVAVQAGDGLWWVAALGGGICFWYSAQLKRTPYADVLAMIAWGGAMPMCGVPLGNTLGLCMAGQLALYSGVFESMQVRRDRVEDAAAGVRTTAVALGRRGTAVLTGCLIVLSSLYCAAVLEPVAGGLSALALLVAVNGDAARDWTRVKVVLGLAWLVCCVLIYVDGASSGFFLQLPLGVR